MFSKMKSATPIVQRHVRENPNYQLVEAIKKDDLQGAEQALEKLYPFLDEFAIRVLAEMAFEDLTNVEVD